MEAEETLPHATKRSRNNVKVLLNEGRQHTATTEEDDDVEEEEDEGGGGGTGGEDEEEGEEDTKQLSSSWQTQQQPMQLQMLHPHPSRIFRVSRASGGKDRHSKVLTAKGLRDRRVRLSVATAIQFYDLQDRLGFDQPSKAVDWLIKAAADAIAELPSLEGTLFHRLPPAGNDQDPAKPLPLISRSACSSTSETSRGSVLSLSRSEIRVKARERARERAKDKVVTVTVATTATTTSAEEVASQKCNNSQQHRPPYSSSSFTDLLMDLHSQHPGFPSKTSNKHPVSLKKPEPPPMLPPVLDYFNTNAAASVFSQGKPQTSLVMPSPNLVNSAQLMSSAPLNPPCDLGLVDHHPELQQFAFLQGNHVPVANSNDYNCFAAGSNRGTLQSNSSALMSHHHHHHLQKFAPPFSNNQGASPGLPFFIGQTQATGGSQFQTGFDARLHLYYSDGCRHTDLKEEGRS